MKNKEYSEFLLWLRESAGQLFTRRSESANGFATQYTAMKVPLTKDIDAVYGVVNPFATSEEPVRVMNDTTGPSTLKLWGIFHHTPEFFFVEDGAAANIYNMFGLPIEADEDGIPQYPLFKYSLHSLSELMEKDWKSLLMDSLSLNPEKFKGRLTKREIEFQLNAGARRRHSLVWSAFLRGDKSDQTLFVPKASLPPRETGHEISLFLTKRPEWYKRQFSTLEGWQKEQVFLEYEDYLEFLRELKAYEELSKGDWRKQSRDALSPLRQTMQDCIVTIKKGRKQCKLHVDGSYLLMQLPFDDKEEFLPTYTVQELSNAAKAVFEKTFGEKDNSFQIGDIAQITYGKKTVYRKV